MLLKMRHCRLCLLYTNASDSVKRTDILADVAITALRRTLSKANCRRSMTDLESNESSRTVRRTSVGTGRNVCQGHCWDRVWSSRPSVPTWSRPVKRSKQRGQISVLILTTSRSPFVRSRRRPRRWASPSKDTMQRQALP